MGFVIELLKACKLHAATPACVAAVFTALRAIACNDDAVQQISAGGGLSMGEPPSLFLPPRPRGRGDPQVTAARKTTTREAQVVVVVVVVVAAMGSETPPEEGTTSA